MTSPTPTFSNFRAEYTSADKRHRVVVSDRAYDVKITTFCRRKSGRSYQVVDTQRFHHVSFDKANALAAFMIDRIDQLRAA